MGREATEEENKLAEELGKLLTMTWWKKIKRSVKFWWQRRTRGWDDSETWNMDLTFAEFILPRLKRFKILTNGYPASLDEDSWNKILDSMIMAFTLIIYNYETSKEYSEHDEKLVQEGLENFHQHYYSLWW